METPVPLGHNPTELSGLATASLRDPVLQPRLTFRVPAIIAFMSLQAGGANCSQLLPALGFFNLS